MPMFTIWKRYFELQTKQIFQHLSDYHSVVALVVLSVITLYKSYQRLAILKHKMPWTKYTSRETDHLLIGHIYSFNQGHT
mgnify:CR=1 FL=1